MGYHVPRDGVIPIPKKVEAIQALIVPNTRKQLCQFIGMINFYRGMWKNISEIFSPLTDLTSKNFKYGWKDKHQKCFDAIKCVIGREVFLAYPDFNAPFLIHTDASKLQIGSVISQMVNPIAFYSLNMNITHQDYTTTEKELISVVASLKEFRNILLGQQITVYTDNKNLTYKILNTERIMRWRLILEEFGSNLKYIKGENNAVFNALSRLEINDNQGASPSLSIHYR